MPPADANPAAGVPADAGAQPSTPVPTAGAAKPAAGTAKEPKKELDPKAKALIELYKTEAAFRTHHADADVAPGRAGMIFAAMAIMNIVCAMLLATQRFPGDGLAFTNLLVAGIGFVILAIGALLGHPVFVKPGTVLAFVDLAIMASTWSKTGPAIHNIILLKLMLSAYLVKLTIDLG